MDALPRIPWPGNWRATESSRELPPLRAARRRRRHESATGSAAVREFVPAGWEHRSAFRHRLLLHKPRGSPTRVAQPLLEKPGPSDVRRAPAILERARVPPHAPPPALAD